MYGAYGTVRKGFGIEGMPPRARYRRTTGKWCSCWSLRVSVLLNEMVLSLCGATLASPAPLDMAAAKAFAATAGRSPQIVVRPPAQSTPCSNCREPFLSARVPLPSGGVASLDFTSPRAIRRFMRRNAYGTNPVLHCPLYFIVRFNVTPGYSERPDVSAIATGNEKCAGSKHFCVGQIVHPAHCSQAPIQIPQRPHSPGRLT